MNIKKLTQWNMARPIGQRLHVETIQERTSLFAARGAMVAMLASIHTEIAPQLAEMRKAQDLLDRCVRTSHEKQGYSISQHSLGAKYYGQEHAFGTIESNLATANNVFAGCLNRGMSKAERETYHASK